MNNKVRSKTNLSYLYIGIAILVLLIGSQMFYKRFDLTQDKRYTLSNTSVRMLDTLSSPIEIDVLLSGKSTSEFRRLQLETIQILEEFASINKNISYNLIDPKELEYRVDLQQKLEHFQLKPAQVQIQQDGKVQTEILYPYAFAKYKGTDIAIPLLKNKLGASDVERIHNSVQNLEYSFVSSFNKLLSKKDKKIAFLRGNGEIEDRYLFDFLSTLKESYLIAPYSLHVNKDATSLLKDLNTYDLLVIAGPQQPFSEAHKHVIDQYLMQGGNLIWLTSMNSQEQHPETEETYIIGRDLNITDMLFKYGLRINTNLVKDVYSAPIVIASGQDSNTQYNRYPWFLYPIVENNREHPITTNIEAVKFEYASSIDTLPNHTKKTILLASSPLSKTIGLPYAIDLMHEINENLDVINNGTGDFGNKALALAVLLEGPINSAYSNRVKPIKWVGWQELEESKDAKLLVVSDATIIANQMDGERPLELGFDKWTNTFYGNKEFLLNNVNYMLDDIGLLELRSKTIIIPFLDSQKSIVHRRSYQYINILIPLALLAGFGFVFHFLRKRKYLKN